MKETLKKIRTPKKITLLNSPLKITYYFIRYLVTTTSRFLIDYFRQVFIGIVCVLISLYYFETGYYVYWIALGIASSIGLGTGLHTFVLFLAPFIAEKTISNPGTIFQTYKQVYLEVFCWGFGTAIGELPPYFVSRAATITGEENEDIKSIELLHTKQNLSYFEKTLILVEKLVQKLGFWGVLLLASVPNPFFDLAGIMCGRFGVKFWEFFGAVFIGKSLIKCTVQATTIIILLQEDSILAIRNAVEKYLPFLDAMFKRFLDDATKRLSGNSPAPKQGANVLGTLWNLFILLMILYFILSTVESLALSYMRQKGIETEEHRVFPVKVQSQHAQSQLQSHTSSGLIQRKNKS